MATYKINEIKSVNDEQAAQLIEMGITTVDQLLAAAKTRDGRKELAAKMSDEVTAKLVLSWTNRADLFRIKGISAQYSDLLEHAGVDTVKELAQRNAANLHAKVTEVNEEHGFVKRLPRPADVESWVAQAKELPRGIEY